RRPLPADIAAIGYADSIKWAESQGAEKYRRGLYILFQRTVPYPMLMTFDAPDSNVTCTRRERSNTPLQALTLLNDPVFFECARALGKRAAATFTTTDQRIKRAFQLCLLREPSQAEMARLAQLYYQQFTVLKNKRENAAQIVRETSGGATDWAVEAALIAVRRVLM